MSKNEYRSFFAQCRQFLRMKYFLDIAGIASCTFSMFMKDEAYNYMLSLDKLNRLYEAVLDAIEKIA